MPPSFPPQISIPPDDPAEGASVLERLGTAAFSAACGALVASAPATLRIAQAASTGTTTTWIALAGASAPLLMVLVLLLRKARLGIRAFGGEGAGARLLAATLWVCAVFVGLLGMGAALRATTHHHALAAATFAVAGLAYAAVLVPFATRLSILLERPGRPVPAALSVFLGGGFLITFALWIGRVPPVAGSPALGGELVDGLAVGIAALFAARKGLANHPILALIGPPLGVALVVAGVSILRTNPSLMDLARTRAPLLPFVYNLCAR